MAEATEADRKTARDLVPHQDWCHAVTHADCCGTPDDEWSCDCFASDCRADVAAALAAERTKVLEPFVALADEMQYQVEYRRDLNAADSVAAVREVDLGWLRLAISNAREPRT